MDPDRLHNKGINYKMDIFNINQYFNPDSNQTWKAIAKAGAFFIMLGYVLYVLKELIVGILSVICIALGGYLLYLAFKLWNSNRIY